MPEIYYRLISVGGLLCMVGIAFLCSEDRQSVSIRTILWGGGIQIALAIFILKTTPGLMIFEAAQGGFTKLIHFSDAGASFLFGSLATDETYGARVAFHVLPIIVFVSALSGILYHLKVIQFLVRWAAKAMQKTLGTSGAESVGAALFVFLGIESVTAIDEYIKRMTRSELFVIMSAFLSTIATSVMGAYVSFGAEAGHLLAASLMSAPAAVVIAKIMVPEREEPVTGETIEFEPEVTTQNILDAAASGGTQGVRLAINVGALLIVFVGLVDMVNFALESMAGIPLNVVFGYAFAPFAAVMGVPWEDVLQVGQLLGVKTVLNEFIAYSRMQEMVEAQELTARAHTISTYALCGFANFGSIGILLGGLRGVAPDRGSEVAALGLKALLAGTLAAFMTACCAGILA